MYMQNEDVICTKYYTHVLSFSRYSMAYCERITCIDISSLRFHVLLAYECATACSMLSQYTNDIYMQIRDRFREK